MIGSDPSLVPTINQSIKTLVCTHSQLGGKSEARICSRICCSLFETGPRLAVTGVCGGASRSVEAEEVTIWGIAEDWL